jgi:hypothetical protein
MARTRTAPDVESRSVVGHPSQPLVGLFLDPDSDELTYFASEEDAEAAIPDSAIEATLNSAGMWSDHDWDEMEAALDRIRHESAPSRPFEE